MFDYSVSLSILQWLYTIESVALVTFPRVQLLPGMKLLSQSFIDLSVFTVKVFMCNDIHHLQPTTPQKFRESMLPSPLYFRVTVVYDDHVTLLQSIPGALAESAVFCGSMYECFHSLYFCDWKKL